MQICWLPKEGLKEIYTKGLPHQLHQGTTTRHHQGLRHLLRKVWGRPLFGTNNWSWKNYYEWDSRRTEKRMDDINKGPRYGQKQQQSLETNKKHEQWKTTTEIAYKHNTRPNCTQIINEWQNKNKPKLEGQ